MNARRALIVAAAAFAVYANALGGSFHFDDSHAIVENALTVLNYAYFTELRIDGDELTYRTFFGAHRESVPIGALQRIDAKRYPGAHSGVSAPHFVARGRASTVKVNTKPYRLRDFAALIATLRVANARFELDPFWSRVARGEDVTKEVALTPRSRW